MGACTITLHRAHCTIHDEKQATYTEIDERQAADRYRADQ
jgi:hypothetical protein